MIGKIAAALVAGLLVGSAGAAPPPVATLAPADRAAVFKAAGFKPRGSQYVRCEEETPTPETKHDGWPDIEVGGPGSGKPPIHRWDGKAYVARR